jgi:hypothetical protein
MRFQFFGSMLLFWLVLTGSASAQGSTPGDTLFTGWAVKASAGLALNQSTFSKAWQGDEVGTVSWIGTVSASADRWLAKQIIWKNGLLLQFGQTHQQNAARDAWLAPLKSSDKITYRGIVLFKYWGFVDPFVAFDVDSQFYTEIDPVRKWLTPTQLTESIGIARYLVSNAHASVLTRVGFAFRERIDRFGTFNVTTFDYDAKTTTEGGFEWYTLSRFAAPEDRTVFTSELRLFEAVDTSEKDPLARQYWSSVDVDWQNKLSNKLYKWISFDLFWQILYDKQFDKRGQFKQTLGAGLTWQLI